MSIAHSRFPCSPAAIHSLATASERVVGLALDDPLEGEVLERLAEDLGEGGRDELVDQWPGEGEAGLPGSVDDAVQDALEDLPPVEQVRDVELEVADRLHLHAHLQLAARLLRDGRRLHQVVCGDTFLD